MQVCISMTNRMGILTHDGERQRYRTLNLLYLVTPDLSLESCGNLELRDQPVKSGVTILSRFNRLVLLETNPASRHFVSPATDDNRVRGAARAVAPEGFGRKAVYDGCSPR